MSADNKTLSFDFGDNDTDKLREISRRMGDFIANFEVVEQKMVSWQEKIEGTIQEHEQFLNKKIASISQSIEELERVMTEAGVARWRIAAEAALQQGQEHIKSIDQAADKHLKTLAKNNEEFNKIVHKSFDRLDRASAYTIKNISEAVSSFRISDFQRLTEQSCDVVEETSRTAIARLRELVKWFHWKNLGMAFGISVFVAITMGLYLNDEMPWDIHKQVVAQRSAGEALMNAWPTLSQVEKSRIIKHSKRAII